MRIYQRQSMRRKKKECHKHLYHHRNYENIQKSKEAKRNIKKTVRETGGQAYMKMFHELDTKEGENNIHKMAKF
jgi:hypothetical protein